MKNKLLFIGLTGVMLSLFLLPVKGQFSKDSRFEIMSNLHKEESLLIIQKYNHTKINNLLNRSCSIIQSNYTLQVSKALLSRYLVTHEKLELDIALDLSNSFINTAYYQGCNLAV